MERSAENIPQSCGERVRVALREIHPASTAKLVARDVGVSQRTVENWLLLVSTPSLDHFDCMRRAYGWLFVLRVFPGLEAAASLVEAAGAELVTSRAAALRSRQKRVKAAMRGDA